MLELYNRVADDRGRRRGPTPYGASVVRSCRETVTSEDVLRFKIPDSSPDEELLEAELHVHFPHVPHAGSSVRHVHVWQVTDDAGPRPVDSRLVPSSGGWQTFHVRSVLASRQAAGTSLGLRLTDETPGGQRRKLTVSRRGHHHNKQPLLVLFSRDNGTTVHQAVNEELVRQEASSAGRSRRSVLDVPPGCQRRQLYIDFSKIGWSRFVLAPAGYDAFHCLGQCSFPLTQEQRPSNHATVQSLAQQMGLSDQVLRPSCVPSTLSSLFVIFNRDDNTVVLKEYTDMVAEECGCQ
ncbi:bone morphogenetic protein 2-like [Pollicipes pollicipes]|uniref:bone morphogenetic protein 2-like n=1 Tax=Pollicipes pollicipes TaxID=41117 RepID=UPI001885A284|nr:bone morphogenetic protein 2-like [Pollicipes pollicipes]